MAHRTLQTVKIEQCCIQSCNGAKYSITCDFVKAFPPLPVNSVNCVFFLIVLKRKKSNYCKIRGYIFELCVLHSNLKFKGLCAVVCISVARMFLVVEGFNMSKSEGATNERIQVTRMKITVKAFSWKKCVFICDSLIKYCVQDKGVPSLSLLSVEKYFHEIPLKVSRPIEYISQFN